MHWAHANGLVEDSYYHHVRRSYDVLRGSLVLLLYQQELIHERKLPSNKSKWPNGASFIIHAHRAQGKRLYKINLI